MKHAFRNFIFTSLLLILVASFSGCSVQSQDVTNVVQTETAKPSPTSSPFPNNTNPFEEPPITQFNVKGIGIGASYETVLRQFGKPLSSKKGKTDSCSESIKTILRYDGLTITFDEDEDEQNIVVIIEVTSPKWEVAPGVSVGASLEDVRAKFGQSNEVSKKSGFDVLTYFDGDGAANFYFWNNKLVKVNRDLNLC